LSTQPGMAYSRIGGGENSQNQSTWAAVHSACDQWTLTTYSEPSPWTAGGTRQWSQALGLKCQVSASLSASVTDYAVINRIEPSRACNRLSADVEFWAIGGNR
jgi:hypothetical protein